jgi:hypothetical protein
MKDEKDKRAKENPMAWILQNLELLLHTRCERIEELVNNYMKTKTTSKAKKWKGKNCESYV